MSVAAATCGKYILERELASGGMGTIWVAFDPQLQRRVALKRLRSDGLAVSQAAERFQREALAIARLQSPNVVQVYDYGLDESGDPFIAMELLEGQDLSRALERLPRWSAASFNSILAQVAKALSLAHAAGVVHRDLKPANIFLARSGNEEIVKVLDFGVAAIEEAGGRRGPSSWAIAGTPQYMSPEQTRGRAVDARSDLWSLAVVAYQALTGRLPFTHASLSDLIIAISADVIAKPSSLVPALGSQADLFFARALARDPADRFQSARELAAAFATLSEGEGARRAVRILVADDEPDMSRLVKQRFRKKIRSAEYELLFATDGEEALDVLKRNPDIDVVLSDIRMPRMDGLSFLARAAEVNPVAKVIMVSAFGDMPNIRQAMNSGAFDFLLKPVNLEDLDATVEKAARHAEELRKAVGHVEENSLLRMFVHAGIVDRLLPAIRRAGSAPGEAMDATIAIIGIHGLLHPAADQSADDLLDILNANYEAIVPEVVARGGTVDRFIGGALVSLFHGEGHASRAVEACLSARAEIMRRAGRSEAPSPFSAGVAVGVESGRVITGAVGSKSQSRLDYTMIGRVLHAALDLASAATKDEILIGPGALAAAGSSFETMAIERGARNGLGSAIAHSVTLRTPVPSSPSSLKSTLVMVRDDPSQTKGD